MRSDAGSAASLRTNSERNERALRRARPGAEIAACWTARKSLLSEATVLLEAGDQHEHRVEEILLGALETITHAEAR